MCMEDDMASGDLVNETLASHAASVRLGKWICLHSAYVCVANVASAATAGARLLTVGTTVRDRSSVECTLAPAGTLSTWSVEEVHGQDRERRARGYKMIST